MVASAVAAALTRAGRTPEWLAAQTSLSLDSLRRRLDADHDFTITDLAEIAAALDVPVSALLPSGR
ncbi:hypothetical protein A4X16_12690 [Microbacterium sp. H83]|nr:hypothetical protein A4X16_12690 [Microbacterium sp. H83]